MMNIILKLTDVLDETQRIDTRTIHFLDTKKNMIMDGEFTKILYVQPFVTMDGWFIECPLYLNPANEKYTNIIWFPPYHEDNIQILRDFAEIEKQLIDYYIDYKGIEKRPQYSLHNQLFGGSIKIYSPYVDRNKIKNIKGAIRSVESESSISACGDDMESCFTKNTQGTGVRILSRSSSSDLLNNPPTAVIRRKPYVVKISGVWESHSHVGLTYKFLQN